MSEILSVTGRDVPAMPSKNEHEWARWLVFFYPALAGLKALRDHDWPALTLWSIVPLVCGLRLWLGPSASPPRSLPQGAKVALILFAVVPVALVEIGTSPWMRWMGVVLAAVMLTGVLRPWSRTRR